MNSIFNSWVYTFLKFKLWNMDTTFRGSILSLFNSSEKFFKKSIFNLLEPPVESVEFNFLSFWCHETFPGVRFSLGGYTHPPKPGDFRGFFRGFT